MPYQEINGRRVFIPDAGISGEDLTRKVGRNNIPGRRSTIIKGNNAELVEPNKTYKPADLVDKYNRPVKWGDMPDRTKGGWFIDLISDLLESSVDASTKSTPTQLFWGDRSPLSKRIIIEQCEDISRNRFNNDTNIDHESGNFFIVNNYRLPTKWRNVSGVNNGQTALAIVFPTDYPKLPPIGFYMKAEIADAPNGHFYSQAYHDADKEMLKHGWKWYCVFVKPGHWVPASYRKPNDWRFGDNIWTYFDLIKEALTSND